MQMWSLRNRDWRNQFEFRRKREYGRGGARGSCTGNNSGRTGKQCPGHRHPGDSRSCGPTGAACEEVPEQETGPEKDRFQGTGRKWGSPEKEKPKQIKPLKHIGAKRQVKTHSIKFRLSIKKAAVQKAAFVFPQS